MSNQSAASKDPSYFNLHVDGIGYLNRVRRVKPKKGQEFLACTVSAVWGNASEVGYTKFDCKVSGAEAQKIVTMLEPVVAPDNTVLIGFRIADIYPEMFTFQKGEHQGEHGVCIKGRLLRIKFAKLNGEAVELPASAEGERVAA